MVTSKEQGARLHVAGIDHKTADMTWSIYGNLLPGYKPLTFDGYSPESPAWSLGALMPLLPCEVADNCGIWYDCMLTSTIRETDKKRIWELSYYSLESDVFLASLESDDIIEVYVQMIEWLITNGYKDSLYGRKDNDKEMSV